MPTTVPIEIKLKPDWGQSLAAMVENQPLIVRAKAKVNQAASDKWDKGLDELDKQRKAAEQTLHETTHSLARFFLEIEANYKQTQNAAHRRAAAAQRLDAQRVSYQEGRITVDRFLDAVSQYGSAVAVESQYKTAYNVAIIAFEEAKGTLLEYDNIRVVSNPGSTVVAPSPGPRLRRPLLAAMPERLAGDEARAEFGVAKVGLESKTVSFDFSVGFGPNPLQFRGTVTVGQGGKP